jgi:hypothetical protein
VYCPVLGIEQQGSTGSARKQQQQAVDPRLQELILHVQAGLGKALRGADAAQVGMQADATEIQEVADKHKSKVLYCVMDRGIDTANQAFTGVCMQSASPTAVPTCDRCSACRIAELQLHSHKLACGLGDRLLCSKAYVLAQLCRSALHAA